MIDPHNKWSSFVSEGASLGNNADVKQASELLLQGGSLDPSPHCIASDDDLATVMADLRTQREELASAYVRKAMKQPTREDGVLAILKQACISLGRSGFGNPEVEGKIRQQLRNMMEENRPLVLPVLMGGAKVANPLKTGLGFLPDLAEWIAWSNLESIAFAIEAIYSPGARIIDVPDLQLHTGDLGVPIEEAVCHADFVEKDLQMLGLKRVVIPHVLEMLRLISTEWVDGVTRLAIEARNRLRTSSDFRKDVAAQVESLIYTLNTRSLGLPYENLVLVYAALAGQRNPIPQWTLDQAADIRRRCEAIATQYVGVNWGIRQLGLVERVVMNLTGGSDYVRLSVHAKPGEPRPKLFSASKYFPSLVGGLLPMHSNGVRLKGPDKTRYGAAFELSARLREWQPITDRSGRFLWFEGKTQ